ncbi:lipocalin family protein [Aquimarina sp. I32.4]|uniref:lipocalin family protein n=1 Tax=Aquimarina sp. I32.4 TaxID=2053903 RepID=UPI000CDEEBFF|nr:lipocalin family protein [Aquimarina sp. I32.4]
MKKVILVATVFLSVLVISCSSDDDANDTTDPVVGTWKYAQFLVDGKEETPLTDCEKKSSFVFSVDGKVEDNFYEDGSSECKLYNSSGTWKKNNDGTYTGTFKDDVEEYTTNFKLSDGKLILEENEAGKILTDVYTK